MDARTKTANFNHNGYSEEVLKVSQHLKTSEVTKIYPPPCFETESIIRANDLEAVYNSKELKLEVQSLEEGECLNPLDGKLEPSPGFANVIKLKSAFGLLGLNQPPSKIASKRRPEWLSKRLTRSQAKMNRESIGRCHVDLSNILSANLMEEERPQAARSLETLESIIKLSKESLDDVTMEGIQLTLKSNFKCKESKLKSQGSLRRICEIVRDK